MLSSTLGRWKPKLILRQWKLSAPVFLYLNSSPIYGIKERACTYTIQQKLDEHINENLATKHHPLRTTFFEMEKTAKNVFAKNEEKRKKNQQRQRKKLKRNGARKRPKRKKASQKTRG